MEVKWKRCRVYFSIASSFISQEYLINVTSIQMLHKCSSKSYSYFLENCLKTFPANAIMKKHIQVIGVYLPFLLKEKT